MGAYLGDYTAQKFALHRLHNPAYILKLFPHVHLKLFTPLACARGKVINLSVCCYCLVLQASPSYKKIDLSLWNAHDIIEHDHRHAAHFM